MNLLLDTCALLSLAGGSLPSASLAELGLAPRAVVSPVVAWEIAIKVNSGKLTLPLSPLDWVGAMVVRYQLEWSAGGLDAGLLCAAAALPPIHRDPFDRVLVATALRDGLVIMTSDRFIPAYQGVKTIW